MTSFQDFYFEALSVLLRAVDFNLKHPLVTDLLDRFRAALESDFFLITAETYHRPTAQDLNSSKSASASEPALEDPRIHELDIEEGDEIKVLRVHREAGMAEGRTSAGKRGWFPTSISSALDQGAECGTGHRRALTSIRTKSFTLPPATCTRSFTHIEEMAGRELCNLVRVALFRRRKQLSAWPIRIFALLLCVRKEEDPQTASFGASIYDVLKDIEQDDNDSPAAVEWGCTAISDLIPIVSRESKTRAAGALFKVLERFPGDIKIAREATRSLHELARPRRQDLPDVEVAGLDIVYAGNKIYLTKKSQAESDLEILMTSLKNQQSEGDKDDASVATAKAQTQEFGLSVALELVLHLERQQRIRPAIAVSCVPILLDSIGGWCKSVSKAQLVEAALKILDVFSRGEGAHRDTIANAEGEDIMSEARQTLVGAEDTSDSTAAANQLHQTNQRIVVIIERIFDKCAPSFQRFKAQCGGRRKATARPAAKTRAEILQELQEAFEKARHAEASAKRSEGEAQDAKRAQEVLEGLRKQAEMRADAEIKEKEAMIERFDEAREKWNEWQNGVEAQLREQQQLLDEALAATAAFEEMTLQLDEGSRRLEAGIEGVVIKYGDSSTRRRLKPFVMDVIETARSKRDFADVLRCLAEFRGDELIQEAGLDALRDMLGLGCSWESCYVCKEISSKQQAAEQAELDERLRKAGASKGAITVSLMWDNESASEDLDLHIDCPLGEISYGNKKVGAGELDVDNQGSGAAVENVFWAEPEPGTFTVRVVNYSKKRTTAFTLVFASSCLVRLVDGAGGVIQENFTGSKSFSGSCLQPLTICTFEVADKEERERREAALRELEEARARLAREGSENVCSVLVANDVVNCCFEAMQSCPSSLRVQTVGAHLLVCMLDDASSPLCLSKPLAMTQSLSHLEIILLGLKLASRTHRNAGSAASLLNKAQGNSDEHDALYRFAFHLLEAVPQKHGVTELTTAYSIPPWTVEVLLEALKLQPSCMSFATSFLTRLCRADPLHLRRFCQHSGLELLANIILRGGQERLVMRDERLLENSCGILAVLAQASDDDIDEAVRDKIHEILQNTQLQEYVLSVVRKSQGYHDEIVAQVLSPYQSLCLLSAHASVNLHALGCCACMTL